MDKEPDVRETTSGKRMLLEEIKGSEFGTGLER